MNPPWWMTSTSGGYSVAVNECSWGWTASVIARLRGICDISRRMKGSTEMGKGLLDMFSSQVRQRTEGETRRKLRDIMKVTPKRMNYWNWYGMYYEKTIHSSGFDRKWWARTIFIFPNHSWLNSTTFIECQATIYSITKVNIANMNNRLFRKLAEWARQRFWANIVDTVDVFAEDDTKGYIHSWVSTRMIAWLKALR